MVTERVRSRERRWPPGAGCRPLRALILGAGLLAGLPAFARLAGPTAGGEPRALPPVGGEVFAVAFSPDGRLLAAGGGGGAIVLWDVASGGELGALRGHAGPVRTLAFSGDGAVLVSGSEDRTVRLWEVRARRETRVLGGHFGAVLAVALSPDQRTLVSGSTNGSLRVFEFASGREVRAMKKSLVTFHSAVFAPDGVTLVTAGNDGRIGLWDVTSGRERAGLSGHAGPVLAVAFSPAEPLVASASADGTIRLWELPAGRERAPLTGHRGDVNAVAFSRDGALLASAGRDGTIRLWDVRRQREERPARLEVGSVVWALAFSPDGALLASGAQDQRVRLASLAALLAAPPTGEIIQPTLGRLADVGPPPSPPPVAVAALQAEPALAAAGTPVNLTLRVTNAGQGPLYRFRARSASPEPALNSLDYFFGTIGAGDTAEVGQAVRTPADLPDSELPIRLDFSEHNGFVPAPLETRIAVQGETRPRFGYRYQVLDDGSGASVGNGDGRLQRGESVDLLVTVKNVGARPAREVRLDVWGPPRRGLRLRGGSADLGTLTPAESRRARVRVEVDPDFPAPELRLTLTLQETSASVRLTEEIRLPVEAASVPGAVGTSKVVAAAVGGAIVRAGAGADTSAVAVAAGGQRLEVSAEAGPWYRVRLGPDEQGWMDRAEVREASAGPPPIPPAATTGWPRPLFRHAPPDLELTSPPDGWKTAADRLVLRGVAASAGGIAAVDLVVNGRRQPIARPGDRVPPATGPGEGIEFVQEVPLTNGANQFVLTVVDLAHQVTRLYRTVHRTR